ncbi:PP2C family protein-serine/threonine phosphatase [Kitasatospora sp. NPDC056138]|uniref:PP2C family protein-serine/threonine phosphatase n=1 Tax=Kitasatospora sp. NPDC056138 TaxID=3345724 RepID=UPI0035D8C6D2
MDDTGFGRVDDAGFGRLLGELLERSHKSAPGELPDLVGRIGSAMGLTDATVFLADVQQSHLVPLPGAAASAVGGDGRSNGRSDGRRSGDGGGDGAGAALAVEGTLAGWAYRTESMRLSPGPELVLWLPLVDGVERIGVLRVTAPVLDAATVERCRALASLVALVVTAKAAFSDVILQAVRTRRMSLQAELAWAFMPPRTLGTRDVTCSAVLEPAYEIGGDAFDHSLTDDSLRLAVVDAMGHDVASGLCSALALSCCRATRRSGGDLADITAAIDSALDQWIPDRLLTGVFADLDVARGELTWVNCGHPPPLLIRHHRVVPGALSRTARLPLGLGPDYQHPPSTIHRIQLEPGDRILIHTDGVTEARSRLGELFGEPRLIDTVVRATAAGEAAPEALRRLIRAILEHQNDRLTDDATILLAEWHPATERTDSRPAPAPPSGDPTP